MPECAHPITRFWTDKAADLQRLSRQTRSEHSSEDLRQAAWLIALSIEDKRGYPVDFTDAGDQDLVIAWLYKKYVSYADKRMRYAVSLDAAIDADEREGSGRSLIDLLPAAADCDPAVALCAQDEPDHRACPPIARSSYSEAAAYAILLARFDGSRARVASHLAIAICTLRRRWRRANARMQTQPSLFDKVAMMDLDFMPPPGCSRRRVMSLRAPDTEQYLLNLHAPRAEEEMAQ